MALAAARFVNLALLAAVFAVVAGTRLAVSPIVKTLAPVPYATYQQTSVKLLGPVMQPLLVACVISPVTVLVLLGEVGTARFWLTALGLAGVVAVVATTIMGNLPLDREVLTWNPKGPPANYFEVRDRWEKLHTLRAAFVGVALAAQIGALVWP